MPSDHPPSSDTLTPEEREELRAIRREADREDAGLFLVQQIERDLAGQGALGPDDYVDLKVDETGTYVARLIRFAPAYHGRRPAQQRSRPIQFEASPA